MSDTADFSEHDDPRTVAAEAAMKAQGIATTEPIAMDYFGFSEVHQVTLPDGVSYVQYKVLNEGDRRKYLNGTNRDVKFQKSSGDAIMRMAPGDEKFALLKVAVIGWNLQREGKAVAFSQAELEKFLDKTNPRIIDLIHKEVVKKNPWLMAEMSSDDIRKEIATLEEQLRVKLDEEAGKASF